jgi:hypothetical protein
LAASILCASYSKAVSNSILIEFNSTLPLVLTENAPVGSIVGSIEPTKNSQKTKLSYSLVSTLPSELSPTFWLDASELDWVERFWEDKSVNKNHAQIQGSSKGYPFVEPAAQNGLSLMHYPGINGAYHSFDEIHDIRTVFWVVSKKSNSWGMLLGHSSSYHFHHGLDDAFFHNQHAHSSVTQGTLNINGSEVVGTSTSFPSTLSLISLQLNGDAQANNFSKDRLINGRFFNGNLGELIIFNQTLSEEEVKEVESYLHRKWDLPLAYEAVLPPFSVSDSGVISSNRKFDHEKLPKLPIHVRATDANGSFTDQVFDILISDVVEDLDQDGIQDAYDIDIDGDGSINDFEVSYGTDPWDPTSVNRSPHQLRLENQRSVVENTPAGFVIGQFQADDADQDALSFSVSGNNFIIEQNGTLRTARSFDHEMEPGISVTLTATDPRGASNSAVFSIEVLDLPNDMDEDGVADSVDPDRDGDGMSNSEELVNHSDPDDPTSTNYAPTDLNSTTALTIIENRPANTIVGQFSAADQESPDSLRFALVSGQGDSGNGLFTLDANGTLRSLTPFDFENNATQYSIRVVVYDEQNASMERSFEIDLLNEDTFSPISLNRNLMLWLDASDRTTLDRGEYMGELGTPEDGNAILFWGDKSGNEHHAIRSSGSPTYLSEGLLGLPTLNTDGDELKVSDSNETFDELNEMTIFAVFKWTGTRAWKSLIAKNNSWNHTSFTLTSMNPAHLNQGTGTFYGLGNTYVRTNGGNVTDARDHPVALSLVYNGNTGSNKIFGNGVQGASSTGNPSRLLSNPEFDVKIGNYNLISEILIFNDALDDSNRERVEGYLAHKWNLLQELDEYHPYKNGGIMDGNAINISEELPIGTPIIQLSEVDPDYNASWSYSLAEANDSNDNELFSVFDPATFDPASLDNLALWLDANDSFTVNADQNGKVSIWHDKSGNANNVTQTDVNKMPTLTPNQLNARSVIQFDGINDFIMSSSLEITQSCFFAIVAKTNNHSSGRNFLFDGLSPATNTRSIIALNHESKIKLWANNWSNSNFDTPSDYFVMTAIFNSNNSSLSLNGTTASGLNPGTSSLTSGIRIGTHASLQDYLYGSIAEFLVVDDAVGTDTQSIVETYLANKWGLVDKLPVSSRFDKDFVQTATSLDYETNASAYNIRVQATANGAVQNEKEYEIYLSNVVEDMDGDGIEDHYDLDVDGDGFSDLIEIAYPSDPRDPDSVANVAPHLINFTGDLSVPENLQVGSQVTTFSATDDDGDSNFTYSIPKTIEKLEPVLWLDANHPSAKSSTWEDLSTYNRDAIRYNTPTVIENAQNGLSVMRYQARSSGTDYHQWSSVNNIRTAFAVLRRNSGDILSHTSTYHFHSNGSKILHSTHAHANLKNGISRLNGLEVDARVTNSPSSDFFLLSFVSIGNVSANRIGNDRNINGSNNHFDGDYGELVIFDKALEDWEVESVEYYLARKWGLQNNLAQTHSYKDKNNTLGHEHLSIDNNGTLTIAQAFDYETDQNFSITVRATDPYGASFDKLFTIEVTDIAEDVDGDGTPDHLDNDIDNDGLSNADELLGKSDPYNSNSTNRPPNAITLSNLSFTENLATGRKIGEFNATDPDGNVNLSFSLYPLLEVSPSLWLDGSDIDGNLKPDTYAVGNDISLWVDKSGNGYDFNETKGQPTYSDKEGKGVVKFDGQTILWTGNSLSSDFNNFTIMSVARYTGGKNGRIISDASN